MATIPTYDNFKVSKASIPNVQMQAPEFHNMAADQAQKQGQAMQGLGQELSGIATDMQHDSNVDRIKEAENDLVRLEHNVEYGKSGFLTLSGKDALTRPNGKSLNDEVGALYKKQADLIAKGLGNDAQKAMFKDIVMQRSTALSGRVDRHVMQENKQYKSNIAHGTIELGQNQMALAWGDPARMEEARAAIISATHDTLKLKGLDGDKDSVNVALVHSLSPAHTTVLMSAIDAGQGDLARTYYAAHRGEMDAGSRLRVKKALEIHDDLQQSQESVDAIYAMEGTPQQRMDAAREITDPKRRKNTVAGLKARFKEDDWLQQRGYEQAAQTAYGMLSNNKPIPASLFAELEPKTRLTFEKMQRDGGRPKENDPTIYRNLANMNAKTFAKVDLGLYAGQLKPSTWESMIQKQAKLRNDGDYSFRTDLAKINSVIEALEISDKNKGAFYDRADAWAKALGHKPTDDELSQWVNNMKEEVLTNSHYWGFFNSHEPIGKIHVDGVPDVYITGIVHALQKDEKDASVENIKKRYNANRKNDVIDTIGAAGQRQVK